MSKAEEAAKEYYQFWDISPNNYREYQGFIKGYNQAVKDINKELMDRMAKVHEKINENTFKDIDYGIAIQVIQSKEDIIAIIQSRIDEIIGDAQPKPALRAELQELITRIKEK